MLLVLILSVTASFAADTNHTEIRASDDTDTVVSISETNAVSSNDDEVYSAGNDSSVLSATAGSFTELSTLINSSTTGSITLDKNYTYNNATDSAFVKGIIINRTISIDGAGFTLNGNNEARIFWVTGSNVLIRDLNFINGNDNSEHSAAIKWYGEHGYLVGSTFRNNVAILDTGAVSWYGAYGTISNCIFRENVAKRTNGAIYTSGTETTISSCIFENNHATTNQGAGNIAGTYNVVTDCTFKDNYAGGNTGGLNWGGTQGSMKNCVFDNNYATNYGAMSWTGSFGVIDDCTFKNNYATKVTGGVYFTGANCRLSTSVFDNNQAKGGGYGALHYNSESGFINFCNFTNNTATGDAGAVYSTANIAHVLNCTFIDNRATNAGALLFTSRNPRILNSTFIHNYASATGGAVIIPGAVFNSYFENNEAGTNGGAILTRGSGTTFRENTFINNTANNGGAIGVVNTKTYISDSIFEGNTAKNNGGAIYCSVDYIDVENSIFTKNNASNLGGAIYATGNYVGLHEVIFNNNKATSDSGAVYVASGKKVYLDYTAQTSSDTVNAESKIDMPNVIYVSPTGTSSGLGTVDSPYDLTTGLANVANGGTVYLQSGTYNPTAQISANSKTLDIIGLGKVIIDLSQITTNPKVTINSPSSLVANISFVRGNKAHQTMYGDGSQYVIIANCTFEDTGAIRQGGRFWTMINCTFQNFSLTSTYSILETNYYMQTVINCTFKDNIYTANGGAIKIGTVGWYIENCTFINNTGVNGGAIHSGGFVPEIIRCDFINNTATTKGGAIYSTSQEIVILDCTFSGNAAPEGGAVYITGLKSSIEGSAFSNNNASTGGAVYSTGRESSVSDSNFTSNGASSQGGAIYSTGTGTSVTNSSFGENSATNGSAIMVGENTDITIEGSDFNNNSGNGSVYVPEGSNFVVDANTTFENNDGGDLVTPGVVSALVLYVNITATGDGLLVTGPTNWEQGFENVMDGGILYILSGTYDFSQLSPIIIEKSLSIIGLGEVIFTNYARGTLFDVQADNVKLSNIKFAGSSGDFIVWNGLNGEIESCVFDGTGTNSNNKLITTTLSSTNFKVTNSNFTGFKYNNLIYTNNFLTTIENCVFKSNTQYSSNSYLIDSIGSDFSIINSQFESNTGKLVNFESPANRGSITSSTFVSNVAGSGNSLIYISTTGSRISNSVFKNSNTGGTYKYIYGTESFALSGNTFEGVTASLNSVSGVNYPNNPTVSGTFNYGVNRANTIPVTANGNLLPNVARSSDATTFSYTWDTPLPNTYTLTFATTDSEGNKYTYTSTPNSVSTTVNRISTVYISPDGTGTGASASSPTTWDNVANLLTDTGSVVFTAGNYKLNGKTISNSWKLSNSGTVIIDAENKGRIFTINANNFEITGITFKNGNVSGNQGSAISWTGTGGKISNSIFTENTGVPISSANDLTITNTQMKNQISLTKSNINWGTTETVKGTFSHSAPSTVTVLFNGTSQGSYTVSSKVATAAVAFTNPSTQAVGSYVVSLTEINNFQVILWSLNQIWSY